MDLPSPPDAPAADGGRAEQDTAGKLSGGRALLPAPDVSVHIVDNEALLFDAACAHVYGLNTTAAFVWCGLEEGWNGDGLAEAYRSAFGRTREEAEAEVANVLQTWRALGLIVEAGLPRRLPAEANGLEMLPRENERRRARQPRRIAVRACYRILSTVYEVRFETRAQFARVDPVLAQFSAAESAAVQAAAAAAGDGFVISIDGLEAERAPHLDGLAPALKSALVMDAVNRHGFAFFLHAAVLRRRAGCLLMPAAPGSGKTCLSLALAAAGFAYHTDEIAFLAAEDLAVRGVPVCPCVKEGAWAVVQPLYPQIARLVPHRRVDGKTVKYLPPPVARGNGDLDRGWPVRWIVFPSYRAGAATELVPLSRVEGLRRLLEECLALRGGLNAASVDRLARWIAGIDCRALTFSSLEDAVALMRDLCAPDLPTAAP